MTAKKAKKATPKKVAQDKATAQAQAEPTIQPNTFEVVRVGWDSENTHTPIACISLAARRIVGVEIGTVVKVKYNNNTQLAVVQPQFKELLARNDVVTIGSKLAELLADIGTGDTVEISKEVTESEHRVFMAQYSGFGALIRALISRR